MKTQILAYAQTGLEGTRWLRDDAEVGGTLSGHLKNRSLREAGLIAVRNTLQHLPDFDIKTPLRKLVETQYEVVGVGSETIVVKAGDDSVKKYLTGKSQPATSLETRIKNLDDKAKTWLGDYLPETTVACETVKLFKGMTLKKYVTLEQPYVHIEHIDPNRDPDLLAARPDIASEVRDLSERLVDLFENEGLLMDIVNSGNLAWGHIGENPPHLYLLDTIAVDYNEKDFTGVKVPFWSPEMHLEHLADFVTTAHGAEYFGRNVLEYLQA